MPVAWGFSKDWIKYRKSHDDRNYVEKSQSSLTIARKFTGSVGESQTKCKLSLNPYGIPAKHPLSLHGKGWM